MAKKTNLDHTELLVLSLLAQEDMYGYQMIAELARQSDHTFEMKEGTLYPVLHTLEHGGAVSSYRAAIFDRAKIGMLCVHAHSGCIFAVRIKI